GAWMIPAAYAVAAIVIGVVLPRLEHRFSLDSVSGISSASAIAIYSAVGTGTMTLSAIVFSLTFVMVQFSATAYSPRLVLWLAEDPLISHALGIFTGAYLYSITAIAWIDRDNIEGVSIIGAIVAVVWLLAAGAELSRQADARIEVTVAVGDTVMESTPLLRVYGASILDRRLLEAIHVGEQR